MKTICTLSFYFLAAFLLSSLQAYANDKDLLQTVRGKITDQDSKAPVIGANIIILGSDPILGSSTDINGNFRIENVPAGRIDLQITCLGYEDKFISNILVGTGKEVILDIPILESVVTLKDVVIQAQKNKSDVINKMATVSAKTFSVEETGRYAGAFSDPARMVSGYAGVTGDPMGNNDIVVRGNSPRGILWRLEGVEIPNPNHFANEGGSGGPINALNSAMLSNSDFFTGAFAPEYGNALSGVFDMRLRKGNNENREYALSAGILGIDFTAEGPIKKGYSGSYLANYRYSSLSILDDIGVVDFGGVPKYQDASFKVFLPTEKAGVFSVFGLGGLSHINNLDQNENKDTIYSQGRFSSDLGVIGLNHSYQFSNSMYLKSSVSASGTRSASYFDLLNDNNDLYNLEKYEFSKSSLKVASTLNKKVNSRHNIQTGIEYTNQAYNMQYNFFDVNRDAYVNLLDTKGNAGVFHGFTSWKYRVNEDITVVSGLHYTQFLLNNNYAIEPRVGARWQLNEKQALTAAFGMHSKYENMSAYMVKQLQEDGSEITPNKNLDFTKARHYVLGYDYTLTKNLFLKFELYYQDIYNVPVEDNTESSISAINFSSGYTDLTLVNKGTGDNYGIELTLERFYANNFYFLITGSLYDSKYTAMDGVERNSAYNGNYAANIIAGKEFKIGKPEKGRVIACNARVTFTGGGWYTPVDLEASRNAGYTVLDYSQSLSAKSDDVFLANLGISYRRDREKATHELKVDIQNVTNNQAVIVEYYNSTSGEIVYGKQWSILPNIVYTLKF